MIPIHPSRNYEAHDLPDASIIVVRGYREGCGKTSLACGIAQQLSKDNSVQVVTSDSIGVNGVDFQKYMVDQLGLNTAPFIIVNEAQENYDVTIYDTSCDIDADMTMYIAPPLCEDVSLGVIDTVGRNFRDSVSRALADMYGDVDITFVDEGAISTNGNSRWLNATDWLVLKELECMFLQDTDIGNVRKYIREASLDSGWSAGVKL
jgi:Ni2+-binding GTPase involved in maturation of urease and hydrogenase